ncbi:hypothetical protein AB6A40_006896 [Gnathostoma spinigerum]|uniref:Phosphatidylinositol-glycan biosynthesis class F protein n=1 Tax=Gnathostoma spinigerum TaxID=75299 RepID=A0ABD6ELW0_9BILA
MVKLRNIQRISKVFVESIIGFYILAVLFGAPFLSHFLATFIFSIVVSIVSVLPLAITIKDFDEFEKVVLNCRPTNRYQLLAHRFSLGGVIGAWSGAIVIPLDWDRWWQRWPLPCIFGCLLFALIGFIVSQFELHTRYRVLNCQSRKIV